MAKKEIRKFAGPVVGWVEEDSAGNKKAITFGGDIKGYYDKKTNTTSNDKHKPVAFGDCVSAFFAKGLGL